MEWEMITIPIHLLHHPYQYAITLSISWPWLCLTKMIQNCSNEIVVRKCYIIVRWQFMHCLNASREPKFLAIINLLVLLWWQLQFFAIIRLINLPFLLNKPGNMVKMTNIFTWHIFEDSVSVINFKAVLYFWRLFTSTYQNKRLCNQLPCRITSQMGL